jgi:hypothetical protein
MSLSLHSSRDALTSSKRGLEKDSDIEPLKSSIGEISSRISARPPTASACSSGERVARHSGLPISQSNEAVCRARRSGTSSGSEIFANETRSGAPGIFCWSASPVRGPDWGACWFLPVEPDSVVRGRCWWGESLPRCVLPRTSRRAGGGCWFVLGRRRYRRGCPRLSAAPPVASPGCRDDPGTPGDPSRRAGSQRAAQQRPTPARGAVHVGRAVHPPPGGRRPHAGGIARR